tara:strand:+ start:21106 stop:21675 length:570 start_codon:yes stop_codon:yes gene_type:complete
MSTIYKHKHHIIPKHAGGSDDPSNIIELTIADHAEAHRKLFEKYGRWQDKIASDMLSGQITSDTARRRAARYYMKNRVVSDETRKKIGDAQRGKKRGPRPEHIRKKIGDTQRGIPRKPCTEKRKKQVSEFHKGKITKKSTKEKLRQAYLDKNFPVSCIYCRKVMPGERHINQYHGNKCKFAPLHIFTVQ